MFASEINGCRVDKATRKGGTSKACNGTRRRQGTATLRSMGRMLYLAWGLRRLFMFGFPGLSLFIQLFSIRFGGHECK
jgi:hypothetical protein